MMAGYANSGNGDAGVSLGGGSNLQPKPAVTASVSPIWSNNNGNSATGGTGSTGSASIVTLTDPVRRVTTTTITAIVPLTSMLTSATQTLGVVTGLSTSASNVLVILGDALDSEDRTVSTVGKDSGLVPTLGNTVDALGSLATGLLAVVSPAAPSAAGSVSGGMSGNALTDILGGVLALATATVSLLIAGLPGAGTFGSVGAVNSGDAAATDPLGGLDSVGTTVSGLVDGILLGVASGTHR